ncbi:MAG: nicotinate (nicotinamide) nucleotide adenylyltransferase [Clostridiales bacterium]|nr:nicotinate (nicotinamide) nucleotide adenylyltransferase [Candidatus Equinaster intestinalis]
MMKNTVIFGGTFNPPHLGHCKMLESVLKLETTEKVIVIPTSVPPHKVCKSLAGNTDRLNMCRLAFESRKNVTVSDAEMRREGKSYTFDTLSLFKKQGTENIAIVCGGDMIVTFKSWYRFEDILKMAQIIAFRRKGVDNGEFDAAVNELRDMGGNITVIEADIMNISSSEIRENIKNREYLLEYLQPNVYDYIVENGLYGE